MAERIHEILLVSRNTNDTAHIAPMGLRRRNSQWLIAPFRPSRTLDNLLHDGCASVNISDDVRVYAGCLTGRREWPVTRCEAIDGFRLRDALSHRELVVERVDDDEVRPRFFCRCVHEDSHRPFSGYNRAQAAVLELAILVSRLNRLPQDKIDAEVSYLQIAVDKTAGDEERVAWDWLMQCVIEHRKRSCA